MKRAIFIVIVVSCLGYLLCEAGVSSINQHHARTVHAIDAL